MKMYGKKQGYMYLSTGVLDYSNKNDNCTITPLVTFLSHCSTIFSSQVLITMEKKQVIQRRK